MIASGSILIGGETFADNDNQLMTAAAVNDRILSFGYTTNVGDITRVHAQAGAGLTGTSDSTSGEADFTFNVGETSGGGITVAADSIGVDATVVRTSTNQTIGGVKTFSSKISGDIDTVDGLHASSFMRTDAASNVTNYTHTHRYYSNSNIATGSSSQSSLEVYHSGAGTDAFMTFHVGGDYAAYLGIDGGINDLAYGGWSAGANSYRVFHAGNSHQFTSALKTKLDGIATGATNTSAPNNTAITFQRNGTTINTVYLNQTNAETVNFTDTNTTYSAASGGGLSLNGTEFSLASTATGGTVVVDLLSANQIQANHIAANSITARELAISNGSSGSAGIYFSTTAMEIHDGTRVRVKIGAL